MRSRTLFIFCVVAAVLLPAAVLACLWDQDTLQMERNRFPTALELITGKFLRHSREFYEWRVADRLEKLKHDPDNLNCYDDLSVAYLKTGRNEKAIETILIKDKKKPGLYETEANYATFLMLSGQWQEGLLHVETALSIKPDAHFGREKYQKRLAEYVLCRRKKGKIPWPLAAPGDLDRPSFRAFLLLPYTNPSGTVNDDLSNAWVKANRQERDSAVKGVLGMMRFADYESPLLLEVLGDLLINKESRRVDSEDEKHLAARAYLKASYAMKDDTARAAYRRKAEDAIYPQAKYRGLDGLLTLEELEADLQQEIAQADAWFAGVRNDELEWIREGKDADQEFTRKYIDEPEVDADPSEQLPAAPFYRGRFAIAYFALIGVGVIAAVKLVSRFTRARRHARPNGSQTSGQP
jgi:hypothetical protein